jgi:hypothetical protein
MRTRNPLRGYQHRLLAAASDLAAMRGVSHAVVQHDGTCTIFQRQACNCVPDISISPVNGDGVLVIDEHGTVSRTGKQ